MDSTVPRHNSARIRPHKARHRAMARDPRPDVDCLAEQIDAALCVGDEFSAALLRKATARLADRLIGGAR